MEQRPQRTIPNAVETSGIGFLTGADVTMRFVPAAPNDGIRFQRLDRPGSKPIPARLAFSVPRQRRTAIECHGVAVEMIEHVMAALAGLQIDNCLVQLDACEPPGFDGSSQPIVDCLLAVGAIDQPAARPVLDVTHAVSVAGRDGDRISASPHALGGCVITYELDYGADAPVPRQSFMVSITPETFLNELAFARTFVLESEVRYLQSQGYGRRTTAKDLLVFGPDGVIDNALRASNECARHKILDCIGDLALLGCDLRGQIRASRSGHGLNRELASRLRLTQSDVWADGLEEAA
jgi:UDP-3-O-acyl N-acetylglucosamine deacetylase